MDKIIVIDMFDFDRRNPHLRANSLEELCSFSGANFVRCTFVTILGRPADPTGENHYLSQLYAGVSKLSIISDLRLSAEGRQHDPGIAGLDKVLRQHRNANRRFIGPIIRCLTGREGNGAVERRLRSLYYKLETERNYAAERAASANHQLLVVNGRIDQIRRELQSAIASRTITADHIGHSDSAGDAEWAGTLNAVLNG